MVNHTPEKVHEILMSKLPQWFKPVLEYIAIMRAYGYTLADIETAAQRIHANQYIQTCDEDTLRYWERLLGLTYNFGESLEYRRKRVLLRLNQTVPYTIWHFDEDLRTMFGDDYSLEVNEKQSWIKIMVTSDVYGAVSFLHNLIFQWVPAHLYVYSNQQVTNYVLSDAFDAVRMTRTLEQTIPARGN